MLKIFPSRRSSIKQENLRPMQTKRNKKGEKMKEHEDELSEQAAKWWNDLGWDQRENLVINAYIDYLLKEAKDYTEPTTCKRK